MRKSQNLTALAVLALALLTRGNAVAGPPSQSQSKVKLHVDSVLASNTNHGIDARLTPMTTRLRSLFNYSSYQLLSHNDGETNLGSQVSFKLPTGHVLNLEPRELDRGMIAMEMVLFEGDRPLMTTDLKLRNHGTLIVGGRKFDEGMLIISIVAESPNAAVANAGDASSAMRGRSVTPASVTSGSQY